MFIHYGQLDSMDCGPTCLRMVARHYGRSYNLQNLRELCHITREGVSVLGISDAAESIGFRAMGVKITWEQFRDEMPLPCIVHWNQRHFVVVYEVKKRRSGYVIRVADPASGLLTYSEEAFCKAWLQTVKHNEREDTASISTHGIALMLEPTPKFYEEKGDEEKKFGFGYILGYLRPYKSFIVQILLAMLVTIVISLILPFITQSVVDNGRIAEEGTHEQLTASRGKYYELVRNQLELGN